MPLAFHLGQPVVRSVAKVIRTIAEVQRKSGCSSSPAQTPRPPGHQ
jgi:hypothetical protein